jgi:NTE family protein
MREMRMFAHAAHFARPSFLTMGRLERRLQRMRFHMIDAGAVAALKRTDTKMLAHTPFLDLLREQGQAQAGAWLAAHFDGVGRRSTVDVQRWFG